MGLYSLPVQKASYAHAVRSSDTTVVPVADIGTWISQGHGIRSFLMSGILR